MGLTGHYMMTIIEMGGLFAPLLFMVCHLLRPLLFIPVVFICVSGGILFGTVAGSIYSLIGITLSSLVFYGLIRWLPKLQHKLSFMQQKLLGDQINFTTTQVAFLRLIPFIHFHMLSLCLLQTTHGLKDYAKASLLSNIPLAVVYTTAGNWLAQLSPLYIYIILLLLLVFIYTLRRKEMRIKWHDFFQPST